MMQTMLLAIMCWQQLLYLSPPELTMMLTMMLTMLLTMMCSQQLLDLSPTQHEVDFKINIVIELLQ